MNMKQLALKTDLDFDGLNDNRLFYRNDCINVYVNFMSPVEYSNLLKELNSFEIKGIGYKVAAWNDSSSYAYWNEEGQNGGCNYIQVTAYIDNINLVNAVQLELDMKKAFRHFYNKYDNSDLYLGMVQNG